MTHGLAPFVVSSLHVLDDIRQRAGHLVLKISIYNEPQGSGIGGSEFVAALLAEALAKEHSVDLFHRIPSLTAERLAGNSGTDLRGVRLRYIESDGVPPQLSKKNPVRYFAASRRWLAELSEPYDIFVAIVHGVPPFCHAARGALIVLFPTPTRPYVSQQGALSARAALRHPAKYLYQSWAWRQRMASYQVKTAISEFSSAWARRRWRVECDVVHPPVDTNFRRVAKEKIILSVGRFALASEGHTKKQAEMLGVFRSIEDEGLLDWKYFSVGGLGDTPGHRAYFERLRETATGSGAELLANVERDELKSLYERAAIFWHAAGYGEDESTRPIFVEHFGISTVEAMAAGCVPVVINKGGQREIVEHGVTGFLWETMEELKKYTGLLVEDDALRERMSEAARARSLWFSREAFVKNFLGRLMSEGQNRL